ncbi:MAG: zinc-ribbon domain-containing protein [Prevotella sp.]|nr:zinc-ribbon domain-containing protein [Prevotella sp.]
MKCSKCGAELKPGQKFCTKCGTPVSVNNPQPSSATKQPTTVVKCTGCGAELKPGQKFCTKCGTPVSVPSQQQGQPGEKGWFTNGVRAVANAITGGALNREIANEQQQALESQRQNEQNQQARDAAEQAERDAERVRDRRNQEAIDGIDVVRGRAIWSIQPGQIARRVTESEFYEIEEMRGVIIQEGCSAIVYLDGNLVGMLSGGAYTFYAKTEAERMAEREAAEQQLDYEERRQRQGESFMDRGLFGTIGIALSTIRRFFFGNKKGETEQKRRARQERVERILRENNQAKLVRVYLVSDRLITLTFGGKKNPEGGIDFAPFTVETKILDVDIAVSLQMQITNINLFLANYLADSDSVTTNQIQQMLMPSIQALLRQMLRNLDYQQEGLPLPIVSNMRIRIQNMINEQMQGIQCIRILQITDQSADFERFRQVERELYCTERELGYLQRTGEFRNRLAIETNKQEIDKAVSDEDLRYTLQQINQDRLLHEDEMEEFVLMLSAQKRLRQAKSQEEVYEALLDLKKNRLVKEDEMAALEDALLHKKIERISLTEIMRIQHQQSIEDARLKAQWALGDQKQDHDWEREDLQRRRNWGIEDEERERAWMHEEQEYNRMFNRAQQQDEYVWQRRIREEDHAWQQEERRREAEWQQRQREEQVRRENAQTEYDRQRQDKFDDVEVLARKAAIAQRNMQAMKDAEFRDRQEQNRSEEALHGMDVQRETKRDNLFANMTAEQIRAAQLDHLAGDAQVAMANAYSKDGENELLKQQAERDRKAAEEREKAAAKEKADLMDFAKDMAGMVRDTAISVGSAQQAMQQQRADEYREDAQRQQDRMDHTMDQALNYTTRAHQADSLSAAQAMGGAPQGVQQAPQQQPYPPQGQQPEPQPVNPTEPASGNHRFCPSCGSEISDDDLYCPECSSKL